MNVFVARLRRAWAGAPRSGSRSPWRLQVAAASFALLLAACGGDDEKAAEANPARSAAATAPTEARKASADAEVAGEVARRRPRPYERIGITALAASPDGIASASADGRVSVLDETTLGESRVLKQTPGVIAGLIFSGGGRYLIGVGRDSVAQVWDVKTGELRYQLHGHAHPLRCVAASDDGSVVATCGEETRVLLWDGATGKLRRVLSGHSDFVNAASVTADGRLLATGGADARVLLWDAAAGQLRRTLLGHADELAALAFSGDGRVLASAGLDGKVLLWDVASGRQLQALAAQGTPPVRSLAFNRSGSLLAGGAVDGKVWVWNTESFGAPLQLSGPGSGLTSVVFHPKNNNRLIMGDQEGRIASVIVPPGSGR